MHRPLQEACLQRAGYGCRPLVLGAPLMLLLPAALQSCEASTPGDLDTAYADALRGAKGEVHLLRLIQKTGPVWAQLSPTVRSCLLEVFIKNVRVSQQGCCCKAYSCLVEKGDHASSMVQQAFTNLVTLHASQLCTLCVPV